MQIISPYSLNPSIRQTVIWNHLIIRRILISLVSIIVYSIAPAFIDTALLKDMIQKETEGGIKLFPIDKNGSIQEVAGLVLWLSSNGTHLLSTVFNDTN